MTQLLTYIDDNDRVQTVAVGKLFSADVRTYSPATKRAAHDVTVYQLCTGKLTSKE